MGPRKQCRSSCPQVASLSRRSEERRVGKECRALWGFHHRKQRDFINRLFSYLDVARFAPQARALALGADPAVSGFRRIRRFSSEETKRFHKSSFLLPCFFFQAEDGIRD